MVDPTQFLDLEQILVYEFAGGIWIFLFLGLLVVAYAGLKYQMSGESILQLTILWLMVAFSIAFREMLGVYAVTVLLSAGFFFWAYSRVVQR